MTGQSLPIASPSRLARAEAWAPGLRVLRTYQPAWLPRDVVAGLVLSALLVPQGMAYAELAGLPAITGLYATVVCLLAYAVFGPSPRLVLGPDSSLGPMIAAAVLPLAAGSPERAIALAGMLALMVGLICLAAGVARLGFVADLLSTPVRVGYLAGLAVTIVVGQLPKLLGISIDADGFLREVGAIVANLGQTNPWTLAAGLLTLAIIVGMRRWAPRAPGVLVAVVAAIAATVLLDLAARGVATVGVLPQGFPRPSFPSVELADLPLLAATALGMALVAIGDTISTSAGFAARQRLQVDANQELVGIGAANGLAGFFQAFPVSTSGSRTAVAEQSGAQTQLTGVVAAGAVLGMLLFVPGLVQNLPQAALAAIIITAGGSLFDLPALRRLLAVRPSEFRLAVACALGVILLGVLQGIVVAVLLSIVQVFARAWRPYAAVMGAPAGVPGYHDLTRYPQARRIDGLLMLRWDAPLFFANATIFRTFVREQVARSEPPPIWVVVAAEPITDLDSTAADMLEELDLELNARGIHLVFAELKDPVKDRFVAHGLLETIDARRFYPTLDAAVEAFRQEARIMRRAAGPPATDGRDGASGPDEHGKESRMAQTAEAWHQLSAQQTAEKLGVDVQTGLSAAEVQQRLQQYGPNRLAGKPKESGWQAFLRQYQDFMQIILLGAAIINVLVTREWGTTLVLVGLTVFNAIMGMNQESKAEASLAALEQMIKTIARVRRDGQPVEIEAEQLVPGDVVLMEAGNVVPADGRLFVAATLEIEEAALTGESVPTLKDAAAVVAAEAPLGDRVGMAYMNTSVTRGRAEMIVTATGMTTEIGHIADMLNKTETDKTPLQKQLDQLSKIIAGIGGIALLLVVGLGLLRGEPFEQLFITGIAMAVAAIPTGLPAVVTTLLSMGVREVAKRNAIVKRLPAVETLGSTSAICSDKTGTLTLNKMTARELTIPGAGNRFTIGGEGYGTVGTISHIGGQQVGLDPFLLPMALCSDAVLDGEALIGDPTEGALIVLAAKGGLDLAATRQAYPRIAEVPFDSAYKFMATFHNMTTAQGKAVVRCYVKGAPDVLLARSSAYWSPDDGFGAITDENRRLALDENDRLAGGGMRVMVVAGRDFDPATFDPQANLLDLVEDLTLLAMVGIVDPPRPEAKAAIAEAKSAGIRVRMITGDHAVTAAAIGRELGLDGRALTGAEFAALSDDEAKRQLADISVIARVAPEDKVRLVRLLQENGEIVAMTGDGVNDAPALKKADIGVAMGITGTEVSKQAAVMILTDDNFATIVNAVEYGRSLYDNLLKYLRFQMASLVGYIATFVAAAVFGIASGAPLSALAVLWLNFAIDIPLAIALGFDQPTPGLMARAPRPLSAPVFTTAQWVRLVVQGLIAAVGVLAIYQWALPPWGAVVASTMLLTTLSLFHVVTGLCARDERGSLFNRAGLPGAQQLRLYGVALLLTLLVTEIGVLQRIFVTAPLSLNQWLVCIGVALSLLVVEEVIKVFMRRSARRAPAATPVGEPARAAAAS